LKELDKTLRQEHRHHHHYRGHSVPDVPPNFGIRNSEPYVAKLNSKENLETIVADLAGEHPQPNGIKPGRRSTMKSLPVCLTKPVC
jgi:Ni,Fe-hydrogenase I large subunit